MIAANAGGRHPPIDYGLDEETLLPEMLLPDTLLEIVPDDDAVPLVPPVVLLTLTPLAFVFVSVVEIDAEVLTDVEQAPLQDALPLVATVPFPLDTALLAWLKAPSPLAKTGAEAMSVNAETAAIHTIILRFISISRFPQTSWPDLSILPDSILRSP